MKLHNMITQYVTYRKALGERFLTNERMLKAFARAMGQEANLSEVKAESVSTFLAGTGPVTANWHGKHQALRGFYRYVLSRGYTLTSPLPTVIPKRPPPFVPYIYSVKELRGLIEASMTYQKNRSRIKPQTVRTIISLLYGAGLRIQEALSLSLTDVNLSQYLLTIHETKFGKTRLVPLNKWVVQSLVECRRARLHKAYPQDPRDPFFVGRDGKAISRGLMEAIFQRIRKKAGIHRTDGARYQPRLHDLRHAFAVHRLTAWYKEGADVQNLLPVLSVYLGHQKLASTSVYLTMTPALLHQANLRFENYTLKEASRD